MIEKNILENLLSGTNLNIEESEKLVHAIASNEINEIMAAGILVALRMKGEHPKEVAGFANGMRALSLSPEIDNTGDTIDVVGTGGDGSKSLNISTGSALLAAACGLKVVKHGNRSISSSSGSADVLESLGFPINQSPSKNQGMLDTIGFTFLFAPNYHPAMKNIAPIRKSLGIRTIFNMLGPLVNPHKVSHLVVGAFSPEVSKLMASSLKSLPIKRAVVIHGENGWDEATPICPFQLIDVKTEKENKSEIINPSDLGIMPCDAKDLLGMGPEENCRRLYSALCNEDTLAHRETLCLGAGIALYTAGATNNIKNAIDYAKNTLALGKAKRLIQTIKGLDGE